MPSRTRAALAAVALVIAVGVSVIAVAAPAGARTSRNVLTALPALDAAILAEINAVRAQHGLPRLHFSRPLRAAASFHSYDMARYGFFSHDSHDGTSPWARLARFYPSPHRQIGETLLWYDGSVGAATAVRDWLSSGEHREILLSANFRIVATAGCSIGGDGLASSLRTLVTPLLSMGAGERSARALARLTKWSPQLPVADEAAGEVEEGLVDVGTAFVAHAEAAILV